MPPATPATAAATSENIAPGLTALAVPVDELDLLPGNPRIGDVDAVAASYRRFGQRKPIVARRGPDGRGTVLAGNHQLQAARQLGWARIAVVWVDDDDATASAYALADNRTAELGGYDDAALAALITEVAAHDAALLADTGWGTEAVDDLLARVTPVDLPPAPADPDDVPDRAPAITQPGDLWQLGPHRLLCGDSTVLTDLDRVLDGGLADIVWTDPPYGVDYAGASTPREKIRNDGSAGLAELLQGVVGSILAGARPGAPVYVAVPDRQALTFAVALAGAGLFRQRLVWVKDRFVFGRSDYHYRHEDIYYGFVPGADGRRGRIGGAGWYGDDTQSTVIEIPNPRVSPEHPTMKPVELITYCLNNSSRPGHVVLDLFGGSGSTLIAAQVTGRTARLIELDPHYCDVICRRYQKVTGDKPVFDTTGVPHDFEADA